MAKRVKPSNYTHRIQFFKQVVTYNDETGMNESQFVPCFKRWANVKIIFREQLESVISGGNTLRNRLELTLRYTDMIDSTMRFSYGDNQYNISIIGDKSGLREEIGLLGEAVIDGGE
ncbi:MULTISPECIES: phage head closure protein [unclassified Granulicatella]|uniref:phage head closure protein n=1 Tax=unclassified Granulicatella TaxID=2630493 RepID=UPI0010744169|nr:MULTISPECIES: phage head closure protein [unclassified Granulicatella]MBF0780510.1 phage head closure protein [Granulicatella sp. 19428wC4_WM01]TFU95325.1 head-tail adaptor protein [Granulicatella sp. WM01]